MCPVDAHFDRRRPGEAIELVEAGGRAVRRDAVPAGRQGGREQVTFVRGRCAPDREDAWVRLEQPALSERGGHTMSAEIQIGSLASGEHTVLRGCKLGDSVDRAVRRHAPHRTHGL